MCISVSRGQSFRGHSLSYVDNFTYQGADDCIAFKGNSTNIELRDIKCIAGFGVAFGWVPPPMVALTIYSSVAQCK